jgi:hypothetical protein
MTNIISTQHSPDSSCLERDACRDRGTTVRMKLDSIKESDAALLWCNTNHSWEAIQGISVDVNGGRRQCMGPVQDLNRKRGREGLAEWKSTNRLVRKAIIQKKDGKRSCDNVVVRLAWDFLDHHNAFLIGQRLGWQGEDVFFDRLAFDLRERIKDEDSIRTYAVPHAAN